LICYATVLIPLVTGIFRAQGNGILNAFALENESSCEQAIYF
jgi:hypothetical protein